MIPESARGASHPPSIPSLNNEGQTSKTSTHPAKDRLIKIVEKLKKYGIRIAAIHPFSRRGVLFVSLKIPIRLVQSVKAGMTAKSFAAFKQKFTTSIQKDWKGGIADRYKSLHKEDPKAQPIIKDALRYAEAVCDNLNFDPKVAGFDGRTITALLAADATQLSPKERAVREIADKLIQLGFECDLNGNFYDPKTSNILFLKDVGKAGEEEITACFHGLGTAQTNLKLPNSPRLPSIRQTLEQKLPELQKIAEHTSRRNLVRSYKNFLKNDPAIKEIGLKKHEIHLLAESLKDLPRMGGPLFIRRLDFILSDLMLTVTLQETWDNAGPALREFFGSLESTALQAIEIGKILKQSCETHGIIPSVTGVSHGGGIAQVAALGSGIKGMIFNSRPMGATAREYLMQRLGSKKFSENASHIHVFSTKGDWLSHTKVLNTLAAIFERVTGIAVPRSVGKGYDIGSKGILDHWCKDLYGMTLEELENAGLLDQALRSLEKIDKNKAKTMIHSEGFLYQLRYLAK